MSTNSITLKVKSANSTIPQNFTGLVEYTSKSEFILCEYFLNGKVHNMNGPARTYKGNSLKDYVLNNELICRNNEQEFYNSKEYKLAKQQQDLLENFLAIKNIS